MIFNHSSGPWPITLNYVIEIISTSILTLDSHSKFLLKEVRTNLRLVVSYPTGHSIGWASTMAVAVAEFTDSLGGV